MSDVTNKTEYLTVRLSKDEYDRFKALCQAQDTTVSAVVRQGVKEMLTICS